MGANAGIVLMDKVATSTNMVSERFEESALHTSREQC
jgi:hypothetical protein